MRCSIFPYHISKRYSAWWSRIQLSRRLTSRPSGFPHALFARAAGSGVLAGGWRSRWCRWCRYWLKSIPMDLFASSRCRRRSNRSGCRRCLGWSGPRWSNPLRCRRRSNRWRCRRFSNPRRRRRSNPRHRWRRGRWRGRRFSNPCWFPSNHHRCPSGADRCSDRGARSRAAVVARGRGRGGGDTRLSVPRPCVTSMTMPAVTATASRPDTSVTIMAVCFEARKRDLRSSSTEYVLPFARLNTISRGLRVEEASSAVTPVAVSGSSRTSVRLPAVRGAAIGIAVLGVLRDPAAGGRGRL